MASTLPGLGDTEAIQSCSAAAVVPRPQAQPRHGRPPRRSGCNLACKFTSEPSICEFEEPEGSLQVAVAERDAKGMRPCRGTCPSPVWRGTVRDNFAWS